MSNLKNYFPGVFITTGIHELARSKECFWLLDLIVSYQAHPVVGKEPFQSYRLKVNPDESATLTVTDGNDNVLAERKIPWTDFAGSALTVWCVDKIILLPSEY